MWLQLHLLCASIIKFISNLAGHAWTTTESTHSIFSSASINSIPFTGFASKQKYWNARNTTGQKTIQETGFPKSIGIFSHLTWKATISTATYEKHYIIRKRILYYFLMNCILQFEMSLRHPKVLWFQSPPSPLPILSVTKAKYYVNLNICLNALISFALIRGYTHPPYLSIDTANSFTISHLDNCSRFWVQYSICSMIHKYYRLKQ